MQSDESPAPTPPGRHSAPEEAEEAATRPVPAGLPPRMEDVQPCGRLGEHEPHVWLTRNNTWCYGSGVAGKGGTPKVGRVLRRQERRAATELAVREAAKAVEAEESDDE